MNIFQTFFNIFLLNIFTKIVNFIKLKNWTKTFVFIIFIIFINQNEKIKKQDERIRILEEKKKKSPEWNKNISNIVNFRRNIEQINKLCSLENIPSFHGHIKFYDEIDNLDNIFNIEYFNSTNTKGMTKKEQSDFDRNINIKRSHKQCNELIQKIFKFNDESGNFYKLEKAKLLIECQPLYEIIFNRYKNTKDCMIAQILTLKSSEYIDERLFYLYVNHEYIKDGIKCVNPNLTGAIKQNMISNDFISFK